MHKMLQGLIIDGPGVLVFGSRLLCPKLVKMTWIVVGTYLRNVLVVMMRAYDSVRAMLSLSASLLNSLLLERVN